MSDDNGVAPTRQARLSTTTRRQAPSRKGACFNGGMGEDLPPDMTQPVEYQSTAKEGQVPGRNVNVPRLSRSKSSLEIPKSGGYTFVEDLETNPARLLEISTTSGGDFHLSDNPNSSMGWNEAPNTPLSEAIARIGINSLSSSGGSKRNHLSSVLSEFGMGPQPDTKSKRTLINSSGVDKNNLEQHNSGTSSRQKQRARSEPAGPRKNLQVLQDGHVGQIIAEGSKTYHSSKGNFETKPPEQYLHSIQLMNDLGSSSILANVDDVDWGLALSVEMGKNTSNTFQCQKSAFVPAKKSKARSKKLKQPIPEPIIDIAPILTSNIDAILSEITSPVTQEGQPSIDDQTMNNTPENSSFKFGDINSQHSKSTLTTIKSADNICGKGSSPKVKTQIKKESSRTGANSPPKSRTSGGGEGSSTSPIPCRGKDQSTSPPQEPGERKQLPRRSKTCEIKVTGPCFRRRLASTCCRTQFHGGIFKSLARAVGCQLNCIANQNQQFHFPGMQGLFTPDIGLDCLFSQEQEQPQRETPYSSRRSSRDSPTRHGTPAFYRNKQNYVEPTNHRTARSSDANNRVDSRSSFRKKRFSSASDQQHAPQVRRFDDSKRREFVVSQSSTTSFGDQMPNSSQSTIPPEDHSLSQSKHSTVKSFSKKSSSETAESTVKQTEKDCVGSKKRPTESSDEEERSIASVRSLKRYDAQGKPESLNGRRSSHRKSSQRIDSTDVPNRQALPRSDRRLEPASRESLKAPDSQNKPDRITSRKSSENDIGQRKDVVEGGGRQFLPQSGKGSQAESRESLPRSEKRPHAESRESLPRSERRPHAESRESLPRSEKRPHAESRESLPRSEKRPHAESRESLPRSEKRPHAESRESLPRSEKRPHAESRESLPRSEKRPHAESRESLPRSEKRPHAESRESLRQFVAQSRETLEGSVSSLSSREHDDSKSERGSHPDRWKPEDNSRTERRQFEAQDTRKVSSERKQPVPSESNRSSKARVREKEQDRPSVGDRGQDMSVTVNYDPISKHMSPSGTSIQVSSAGSVVVVNLMDAKQTRSPPEQQDSREDSLVSSKKENADSLKTDSSLRQTGDYDRLKDPCASITREKSSHIMCPTERCVTPCHCFVTQRYSDLCQSPQSCRRKLYHSSCDISPKSALRQPICDVKSPKTCFMSPYTSARSTSGLVYGASDGARSNFDYDKNFLLTKDCRRDYSSAYEGFDRCMSKSDNNQDQSRATNKEDCLIDPGHGEDVNDYRNQEETDGWKKTSKVNDLAKRDMNISLDCSPQASRFMIEDLPLSNVGCKERGERFEAHQLSKGVIPITLASADSEYSSKRMKFQRCVEDTDNRSRKNSHKSHEMQYRDNTVGAERSFDPPTNSQRRSISAFMERSESRLSMEGHSIISSRTKCKEATPTDSRDKQSSVRLSSNERRSGVELDGSKSSRHGRNKYEESNNDDNEGTGSQEDLSMRVSKQIFAEGVIRNTKKPSDSSTCSSGRHEREPTRETEDEFLEIASAVSLEQSPLGERDHEYDDERKLQSEKSSYRPPCFKHKTSTRRTCFRETSSGLIDKRHVYLMPYPSPERRSLSVTEKLQETCSQSSDTLVSAVSASKDRGSYPHESQEKTGEKQERFRGRKKGHAIMRILNPATGPSQSTSVAISSTEESNEDENSENTLPASTGDLESEYIDDDAEDGTRLGKNTVKRIQKSFIKPELRQLHTRASSRRSDSQDESHNSSSCRNMPNKEVITRRRESRAETQPQGSNNFRQKQEAFLSPSTAIVVQDKECDARFLSDSCLQPCSAENRSSRVTYTQVCREETCQDPNSWVLNSDPDYNLQNSTSRPQQRRTGILTRSPMFHYVHSEESPFYDENYQAGELAVFGHMRSRSNSASHARRSRTFREGTIDMFEQIITPEQPLQVCEKRHMTSIRNGVPLYSHSLETSNEETALRARSQSRPETAAGNSAGRLRSYGDASSLQERSRFENRMYTQGPPASRTSEVSISHAPPRRNIWAPNISNYSITNLRHLLTQSRDENIRRHPDSKPRKRSDAWKLRPSQNTRLDSHLPAGSLALFFQQFQTSRVQFHESQTQQASNSDHSLEDTDCSQQDAPILNDLTSWGGDKNFSSSAERDRNSSSGNGDSWYPEYAYRCGVIDTLRLLDTDLALSSPTMEIHDPYDKFEKSSDCVRQREIEGRLSCIMASLPSLTLGLNNDEAFEAIRENSLQALLLAEKLSVDWPDLRLFEKPVEHLETWTTKVRDYSSPSSTSSHDDTCSLAANSEKTPSKSSTIKVDSEGKKSKTTMTKSTYSVGSTDQSTAELKNERLHGQHVPVFDKRAGLADRCTYSSRCLELSTQNSETTLERSTESIHSTEKRYAAVDVLHSDSSQCTASNYKAATGIGEQPSSELLIESSELKTASSELQTASSELQVASSELKTASGKHCPKSCSATNSKVVWTANSGMFVIEIPAKRRNSSLKQADSCKMTLYRAQLSQTEENILIAAISKRLGSTQKLKLIPVAFGESAPAAETCARERSMHAAKNKRMVSPRCCRQTVPSCHHVNTTETSGRTLEFLDEKTTFEPVEKTMTFYVVASEKEVDADEDTGKAQNCGHVGRKPPLTCAYTSDADCGSSKMYYCFTRGELMRAMAKPEGLSALGLMQKQYDQTRDECFEDVSGVMAHILAVDIEGKQIDGGKEKSVAGRHCVTRQIKSETANVPTAVAAGFDSVSSMGRCRSHQSSVVEHEQLAKQQDQVKVSCLPQPDKREQHLVTNGLCQITDSIDHSSDKTRTSLINSSAKHPRRQVINNSISELTCHHSNPIICRVCLRGPEGENMETGTARQNMETGTARQNMETGTERENMEAGTARQNMEAGTARQNMEAGTERENMEAGTGSTIVEHRPSCYEQAECPCGRALSYPQRKATCCAENSEDTSRDAPRDVPRDASNDDCEQAIKPRRLGKIESELLSTYDVTKCHQETKQREQTTQYHAEGEQAETGQRFPRNVASARNVVETVIKCSRKKDDKHTMTVPQVNETSSVDAASGPGKECCKCGAGPGKECCMSRSSIHRDPPKNASEKMSHPKEQETQDELIKSDSLSALENFFDGKLQALLDKALRKLTLPGRNVFSRLTKGASRDYQEKRPVLYPSPEYDRGTCSSSLTSHGKKCGSIVSVNSATDTMTEKSITEESVIVMSVPANPESGSRKKMSVELSKQQNRTLIDWINNSVPELTRSAPRQEGRTGKYVLSIKRKRVVSESRGGRKKKGKATRDATQSSDSGNLSNSANDCYENEADKMYEEVPSQLGCDRTLKDKWKRPKKCGSPDRDINNSPVKRIIASNTGPGPRYWSRKPASSSEMRQHLQKNLSAPLSRSNEKQPQSSPRRARNKRRTSHIASPKMKNPKTKKRSKTIEATTGSKEESTVQQNHLEANKVQQNHLAATKSGKTFTTSGISRIARSLNSFPQTDCATICHDMPCAPARVPHFETAKCWLGGHRSYEGANLRVRHSDNESPDALDECRAYQLTPIKEESHSYIVDDKSSTTDFDVFVDKCRKKLIEIHEIPTWPNEKQGLSTDVQSWHKGGRAQPKQCGTANKGGRAQPKQCGTANSCSSASLQHSTTSSGNQGSQVESEFSYLQRNRCTNMRLESSRSQLDFDNIPEEPKIVNPLYREYFFSYLQYVNPFKSTFLRREMHEFRPDILDPLEPKRSKNEDELLRLYASRGGKNYFYRSKTALTPPWLATRQNMNKSWRRSDNELLLLQPETSDSTKSVPDVNTHQWKLLTSPSGQIRRPVLLRSPALPIYGSSFLNSIHPSINDTLEVPSMFRDYNKRPSDESRTFNCLTNRWYSAERLDFGGSHQDLIRRNRNESANNGSDESSSNDASGNDELEIRETDQMGDYVRAGPLKGQAKVGELPSGFNDRPDSDKSSRECRMCHVTEDQYLRRTPHAPLDDPHCVCRKRTCTSYDFVHHNYQVARVSNFAARNINGSGNMFGHPIQQSDEHLSAMPEHDPDSDDEFTSANEDFHHFPSGCGKRSKHPMKGSQEIDDTCNHPDSMGFYMGDGPSGQLDNFQAIPKEDLLISSSPVDDHGHMMYCSHRQKSLACQISSQEAAGQASAATNKAGRSECELHGHGGSGQQLEASHVLGGRSCFGQGDILNKRVFTQWFVDEAEKEQQPPRRSSVAPSEKCPHRELWITPSENCGSSGDEGEEEEDDDDVDCEDEDENDDENDEEEEDGDEAEDDDDQEDDDEDNDEDEDEEDDIDREKPPRDLSKDHHLVQLNAGCLDHSKEKNAQNNYQHEKPQDMNESKMISKRINQADSFSKRPSRARTMTQSKRYGAGTKLGHQQSTGDHLNKQKQMAAHEKNMQIKATGPHQHKFSLEQIKVPAIEKERVRFACDENGDWAEIGRGSYGCVYLGLLDGVVEVAIKDFYESSSWDLVIHEARMLMFLQDTGITPKFYGLRRRFDISKQPSEYCIVMEYFGDGRTLFNVMSDKMALAGDEWMDIVGQLVAGLRLIHRKNVLINDLKADNILIDLTGGRKIIRYIDVGMATYKQGLTFQLPQDQMSKYNFLAPEVREGARTTTRSDIYSLGYMLEQVCRMADSALGGLKKLVVRCMEKNPARRPDIDDIVSQVHRFIASKASIMISSNSPREQFVLTNSV